MLPALYLIIVRTKINRIYGLRGLMMDCKNSLVAFSTSFACSNALINAVPIMAPFVYLQAVSNVCLSFIPNPTRIGFFNCISFKRCKYFSTSKKFLSPPVIDEDETAYKKPEL